MPRLPRRSGLAVDPNQSKTLGVARPERAWLNPRGAVTPFAKPQGVPPDQSRLRHDITTAARRVRVPPGRAFFPTSWRSGRVAVSLDRGRVQVRLTAVFAVGREVFAVGRQDFAVVRHPQQVLRVLALSLVGEVEAAG